MHLEPNKIHHIPVRVTYTLPAHDSPAPYYSTGYTPPPLAESTYTTTCDGLVPVFVHDHQGSGRRVVKEEDAAGPEPIERVASVCLKSLVKAICLSSPELIPSQRTPDSKIYTRTIKSSRRVADAWHAATPGLSSDRSRSSSVVPLDTPGYPAWHPPPQVGFTCKPLPMDTYPASSPYQHLHTPHHPPLPPRHDSSAHLLHPKSTIAGVLLEPGTGKTTVLGRLVPASSHMLDTVEDAAGCGVEALARLAGSGVEAVLEVLLVLSSSMGVEAHGGMDSERERGVFHALGLVASSVLREGTDVRDMGGVKPEPEWTDSSLTSFEDSEGKCETSAEPSSSSSSRGPVPRVPTAFRPFRPTCSKMAIFESQSQSRRQGIHDRRRRRHLESEQTSPSNIFSRTRSRTRLGMGTSLEQVANVSNVVRLARKNPSALVKRFLSGHTATSPVKVKGNGSGFTIDPLPNGKARTSSTVKTLNIATGSSKKRKVVSVVLDDEGRPVRWGAGASLPLVNVVPVNHVPPQPGSKTAGAGAGGRGQGASTLVKSGTGGKTDPQALFGRNLPICSNCGITESNTWRTMGKGGQRVCNACGLYWNNKGKVRPKELWEKDIARWKKRRAKAAEKSASSGSGRATTASTPAPKADPVPVSYRSAVKADAPLAKSNLAPPQTGTTGLKRNLSAVAEQEAQQRADHRKSLHAKSRTEQLAGKGDVVVRGNKENVLDRDETPTTGNFGATQRMDPCPTTCAQRPGNANPSPYHIPSPLIQQLKEHPEAVVKRYWDTAVHLPVNAPIGASQTNTQVRSPATSPTETGSVIHTADEAIPWGDADLAGLFKLSQSQKAESVGSFATTVNHPQECAVPRAAENVGGYLGSDEFAMEGVEQDAMYQDGTDFGMETDPYGQGLPSGMQSVANSSPAGRPFDFSQLPPSSPPTYQDEVDHAAAIWSSSPETSPVDFATISVKEVSPLKPMGEGMDDLLQSLERSAQAEALRLINEHE